MLRVSGSKADESDGLPTGQVFLVVLLLSNLRQGRLGRVEELELEEEEAIARLDHGVDAPSVRLDLGMGIEPDQPQHKVNVLVLIGFIPASYPFTTSDSRAIHAVDGHP